MADEKKEMLVAEAKVLTFKQVLGQSDDLAQNNRATRLCKAAQMDYQAIIDTRTKEIFKLEDELEAMSDMSASNSTLSRNAIEPTKFNSEKYVTRRCELLILINVAKAELDIIKEDEPFYV